MDQKAINETLETVYCRILRQEMMAALGCTEPIAVAYAAAVARQTLGCMPRFMTVWCSGNIIKNVKGVDVPNAMGLRGIEAAAVLGAVGGDPSLELRVLTPVTGRHVTETKRLLEAGFCVCKLAEGVENLYVRIEAEADGDTAEVVLEGTHTNITYVARNGVPSVKKAFKQESRAQHDCDRARLNLHDILTVARTADIERFRDVLENQLRCNCNISEEGLTHEYGAEVGRSMFALNGDSWENRAIAKAAAGSDARMGGCALPVVINSGSGNQGMTISLPIAAYAETHTVSEETVLRGLIVANLLSVHIKSHIGSLSAFCGAVSAGCASVCGIAFMEGASEEVIGGIITNALCTVGGMVCDGAKASCAAKIAMSLETAFLAYHLSKEHHVFEPGEGLVGENVEETIDNIGRMGRNGMGGTDVEILHIMTGN